MFVAAMMRLKLQCLKSADRAEVLLTILNVIETLTILETQWCPSMYH